MIGINLFVLKFLLFLFIVVWLFRAPHTMPYNQAQGAPARIEQRETGKRALFSDHSDEDGHRYRLADRSELGRCILSIRC